MDVLLPLATGLALVGLWEFACRQFDVPSYLIPAPSAIWADATKNAGMIAGHTLATLWTVMLGFVASIVVSLPLAVAIVSTPIMANTI